MSARRRQTSTDPLRTGALGAMTAALVSLIAVATSLRFWLPLSTHTLVPLKSGLAFGVAMAIVLRHLSAHRPMPRFGPANQITTARAALVALVAGIVGEAPNAALAWLVVVLAVVVCVLDGADGIMARKTGLASPFGARFDMETDAFLILLLSVLAWQFEKVPMWVILSGLLRYLFLCAGWIWTWMQSPLPPSRRRQTVCIVQIVGLIVALVPAIEPRTSTMVAVAALLVLCWSFWVDVYWLWAHATGMSAVGAS